MTDDDPPGVASRGYDGPAVDGTVQYITERPVQPDDSVDSEVTEDELDPETIYVTPPTPPGTERTVGEPQLLDDDRRDQDRSGQTTLDEWGSR